MRKFILPALWLGLITVLSVLPSQSMPKFSLVSADKFGHAFVYAVLSWLLLRAMDSSGKTGKSTALLVVLGAVAYGVLMEFVQYYFCPGRFYEYDDMIANAMGALLGWGVWRMFR